MYAYSEKLKQRTLQFTSAGTYGGREQNLLVELRLNEIKGLFTIAPKVNSRQFDGDEDEDAETLDDFRQLMGEALDAALEWRAEWQKRESRKKVDPDQLELVGVSPEDR